VSRGIVIVMAVTLGVLALQALAAPASAARVCLFNSQTGTSSTAVNAGSGATVKPPAPIIPLCPPIRLPL